MCEWDSRFVVPIKLTFIFPLTGGDELWRGFECRLSVSCQSADFCRLILYADAADTPLRSAHSAAVPTSLMMNIIQTYFLLYFFFPQTKVFIFMYKLLKWWWSIDIYWLWKTICLFAQQFSVFSKKPVIIMVWLRSSTSILSMRLYHGNF